MRKEIWGWIEELWLILNLVFLENFASILVRLSGKMEYASFEYIILCLAALALSSCDDNSHNYKHPSDVERVVVNSRQSTQQRL